MKNIQTITATHVELMYVKVLENNNSQPTAQEYFYPTGFSTSVSNNWEIMKKGKEYQHRGCQGAHQQNCITSTTKELKEAH